MNLRRHIPTLLAGLAAVASLWLLSQLRPTEQPLPSGSRGPDFYLGRFALLGMDTQGHPRYRIEADGLQHLPDRAESHLQRPRFFWRVDEDRQWHARSGQGVLTDDRARLLLGDTVTVEGRGRNGPLRLETGDLDIRLDQGQAATARPVTMTTPRARLTATGLRLAFESRRLQLLRDVRARYEP